MTGSPFIDVALLAAGLILAGFTIGLGLGVGSVVAEWVLFGRRSGSEGL